MPSPWGTRRRGGRRGGPGDPSLHREDPASARSELRCRGLCRKRKHRCIGLRAGGRGTAAAGRPRPGEGEAGLGTGRGPFQLELEAGSRQGGQALWPDGGPALRTRARSAGGERAGWGGRGAGLSPCSTASPCAQSPGVSQGFLSCCPLCAAWCRAPGLSV